jgi:hypothetical protein
MAPQQASRDGTWWDGGGEQIIELFDKGLDLSIDLLSCDVDRQKRSLQRSSRLLSCNAEEEEAIIMRDYTQLHDEFLESLLQEQTKLQSSEGTKDNHAPLLYSNSSSSSLVPPLDSCTADFTTSSMNSSPSKRRRRQMKVSRKSPAINRKSPSRPSRRQVVDVSSMQLSSLKSSTHTDSSSISLSSQWIDKELAPPCTYVHPNCRLQKDKGKGEPIGSDICATGLSPCLDKVRQKIELLTQVSLDTKKKSTNMKRRKAKVTEETASYTETRSVIELRMGFLSMQYGVLLRWDLRTGKILLVVLRKMCHESFYVKELVSTRAKPTIMPTTNHVYNVVDGNKAILQLNEATEVTLLEAPFRVAQPLDFTPTLISVTVLRLIGLPSKYQYSIVVTYQGIAQSCILDRRSNAMKPMMNNDAFEWHIPPGTVEVDFDVAVEQRRHRTKRKSVLRAIKVWVNVLDPARLHILKLTDSCTLTLGVEPQSQFVSWVRSELDARNKEEILVNSPRRSDVAENSSEEKLFGDLCCIC